MTLVVLVDTDVVVSGLLVGVGPSPNAVILDAMLKGTVRFVLSDTLLSEYRRVLLRPAIARGHGLTEADVDAILEELVLNAGFREPGNRERADSEGSVIASTPGDEPVVALLEDVPEAVLVSGDRRLRAAVARCRAVLTPSELAAIILPADRRFPR